LYKALHRGLIIFLKEFSPLWLTSLDKKQY